MCAHARPGGVRPGPSTGGHYGEALFRPEQPGEDDRIDLGALAYDDITMARLRSLGVGPGWNCLDVGAGTGTVARRLLYEAGVATVLAVDRDVRFLTAHPCPGSVSWRRTSAPRASTPADFSWSTPDSS